LELRDVHAFAAFAGANGVGKSNFFDALEFVSLFVRYGINEALRLHGGYENINCLRLEGDEARTFELGLTKKVN
jgi:predicted ATPase